MGLSSFKFSWWAPKDALVLKQSAYYCPSSSSNDPRLLILHQSKGRMRLPVRHSILNSNPGPILSRFRDIAGFLLRTATPPRPIPLDQGVPLGRYQRHRRTDGRTAYDSNTALARASSDGDNFTNEPPRPLCCAPMATKFAAWSCRQRNELCQFKKNRSKGFEATGPRKWHFSLKTFIAQFAFTTV